MRRLLIASCAAVVVGCTDTDRHDSAATSVEAVGTMSREDALRRFRVGLARVDSLQLAANSRDALVGSFVRAVEGRDSIRLGAMLLSRSEFAYLFYPSSAQGLPPYDLTADLMWSLLSRQTDRGIGYTLQRLGGRPLGFLSYDCGPAPLVEGNNRIWGPCLIRRVRAPGDTVRSRLTGPILERDGRFKFVTYTNDDD